MISDEGVAKWLPGRLNDHAERSYRRPPDETRGGIANGRFEVPQLGRESRVVDRHDEHAVTQ